MKILVTPTSLQPGKQEQALQKLRAFSEDLIFNPTGKPLTEEELIPLLQDCEGYLAGLDNITEKVLASCPSLRAISRYGAGVDRVDLQAAAARQILVSNTPGANAEAVGELAFGLVLALARQIPALDRSTRAGDWVRVTGVELYGKTLGIVGLGAIGKVMARCAKGFGMSVCAYDPYIDSAFCQEQKIQAVDLDTLFASSDVISLHLPLLEETKNLVDQAAFAKMKDGVLLVNASRGGIVDEEAAKDALESGKLGGLGLDAFSVEPPQGSPLFAFDNVIATPHTGSHTKEATEHMADMAVDNLIAMLRDGTCPHLVSV